MLSSSDISTLFIDLEGKEPDDTLNIIYNSSEVDTAEYRAFRDIVEKKLSNQTLYEVESKVYNNLVHNYINAVDKKLQSVQANDLIGLTRVISDIRKLAPMELIGICNERIDYHLNHKRTSGMANNSHRVIKDKLDHALNNKLSSASELYRDRY